MPRILAVDWGRRRVGLALSDPEGVVALGLETLHVRAQGQAVARVAEIALERGVELIVVGLPLLMSGEAGESARSAQSFAAELAEACAVPVETYDERLTTALSARRLRSAGVRTGRARARIDQGAAVALLESFLLRLQARKRSPGA